MAGAMVFLAAVSTTQVALQFSHREADRQLERLGQVYIDGIAASVREGIERRDESYVALRFQRAFAEQRGVEERALYAFANGNVLIARQGDAILDPDLAATLDSGAMRIQEGTGLAWLARDVMGDAGPVGRVVAALDIGPMLAARRRLAWAIIGVDLLLALLGAVLTWVMLERAGRPLRLLVDRLSDAAHRRASPFPDSIMRGADPRTAVIFGAYNRMAEGMEERERLTAELAEREQAAALGRMAATIAHEVRNPLGGLATAVSTLRRFGADAAVREESLAFLDRGITALERIVNSTLGVYRPEEDRRLTRADLEDLRHLARPAAERHGVTLRFELDLPETPLALGSGGIRQVLLNLLLNACAATPRGGRVVLRAAVQADELLCEVTDEGPGLGAEKAARLAQGAPAGGRQIGLDVVVGLLGSLNARATVQPRPEGGTLIRLAIPLAGTAAP